MIDNSIILTPEEQAKVNDAIAALHEVFDSKLQTLTTSQIRSAQKLGDKSIAYVTKCCEYMEKYPSLVPPYIDVVEIRKEVDSINSLKSYSEDLTPITTGIKDSRIAIGMGAIHLCNSYYKTIAIAAQDNIQQAKSIHDDLKSRYPGFRKKKKEEKKEEKEEENK